MLDEVTADEPLDFFTLFSSIAAATGNAGQTDYAAANTYLDELAAQREQQRVAGRRQGNTLSLQWPHQRVQRRSGRASVSVENGFVLIALVLIVVIVVIVVAIVAIVVTLSSVY